MANDTYIDPGLITNYTRITDLMSAGDQVLAQQLHDIQVTIIIGLALLLIIIIKQRRK